MEPIEIEMDTNLIVDSDKQPRRKKFRCIVFAFSLLVILIVATIIIVVYRHTTSKHYRKENAKAFHLNDNILLAVLLDGFKPEYLTLGITPTLTKLVNEGVSGKLGVMYPANTYPNLYGVYTGLYPESSGIVQNVFYDESRQELYDYDKPTVRNLSWYKGEPIWITAQKNGMKTALYMWKGPKEHEATYVVPFNNSLAYGQHVEQILDFFKMPVEKRPKLIVLYVGEPDAKSHRYGPFGAETLKIVQTLDGTLNILIQEIEKLNLNDKVNMIFTADHGMTLLRYACNKSVDFQKMTFPSNVKQVRRTEEYQLVINSTDTNEQLYKKFKCFSPLLDVYKRDSHLIPKRLHYQNNKRIGDLLLIANAQSWIRRTGWLCNANNTNGQHGYDPITPEMQALFVAHGPAFKKGIKNIQIQNVEIYNLMADLLQIHPAPNNGTKGSYNYFLKKQFKVEIEDKDGYSFTNIVYPLNSEIQCNDCKCPINCQKNDSKTDVSKKSKISGDYVSETQKKHFPWSLPKSYLPNYDTFIFSQHDFVIGYNKKLKIPLWEGHQVSNMKNTYHHDSSRCFHLDIRLDKDTTINCMQFSDKKIVPWLLVDGNSVGDDSVVDIISNVVPFYEVFVTKQNNSLAPLQYLNKFVSDMSHMYGNIHIMSGLIFDYDNNGLADENPINVGEVPLASHFYKILMKCKQFGVSVDKCGEDIDVLTFILPHVNETLCENHSVSKYVHKYVATLRDVELLTGLQLLTGISKEKRAQLIAELNTVEKWVKR